MPDLTAKSQSSELSRTKTHYTGPADPKPTVTKPTVSGFQISCAMLPSSKQQYKV